MGQLPGPPVNQNSRAGGQGQNVPLGEGAAAKVGAVPSAGRPGPALNLGGRLVVGLLKGLVVDFLQLALGAGEEGAGQIAQGDQTVSPVQSHCPPGQGRREPQRAKRKPEFAAFHVPSSSFSLFSRWEIM